MKRPAWFWFLLAGGALGLDIALVAVSVSLYNHAHSPPRPVTTPPAMLASPTNIPVIGTLPAFETLTVGVSVTPPVVQGAPTGHLVFTCQLAGDQICIMNADGSGMRQLTFDRVRHWYASPAPDGQSVVYSAYRVDNVYEIYELDLCSGAVTQLTDNLGILKAPEISPDGTQIVFGNGDLAGGESIWVMDRDGGNPRLVYETGWDPTWSPDGSSILFASLARDNSIQLFVIGRDGSGLYQVSSMGGLRGRSDWSPDGGTMATYAGEQWGREIYFMDPDGSDLRAVTSGGDNLAPSFSPDGGWVAFMSYRDNHQDPLGCEVYVMRIADSFVLRLTYNSYCDWQPRWGP